MSEGSIHYSFPLYTQLNTDEGERKKTKKAPKITKPLFFSNEVTPLDKDPPLVKDPEERNLLSHRTVSRVNSSPLFNRGDFSQILTAIPPKNELRKELLTDKFEALEKKYPEKKKLLQFLKRFREIDLYLLAHTFVRDPVIKRALLADGSLEKSSKSSQVPKPLYIKNFKFEGQEQRLILEDLFSHDPTFPHLVINGVNYKFLTDSRENYFTTFFKTIYEHGWFEAGDIPRKVEEDVKRFLGEKQERKGKWEVSALQLLELFPADSFSTIDVEFRMSYPGLFAFEGLWSREIGSSNQRELEVYIFSNTHFCVVRKEKFQTWNNAKEEAEVAATFDCYKVITCYEGEYDFSQVFANYEAKGKYEKVMQKAFLKKLPLEDAITHFLSRFSPLDQYSLAHVFFVDKKLRLQFLKREALKSIVMEEGNFKVKPLRLKDVKFKGQTDELLKNELCGGRKLTSLEINGKEYLLNAQTEEQYFCSLFESFQKAGFFSQTSAKEQVKEFLQSKWKREERNQKMPQFKLIELLPIGSFASIESAFFDKYPKLLTTDCTLVPVEKKVVQKIYLFSNGSFCVVKEVSMRLQKGQNIMATFDDRKYLAYLEGRYQFSQIFLNLKIEKDYEKTVKRFLGIKK